MLFKEIVNNPSEMLIATGLKGEMVKSILENVIGQLSDGMWENSRIMEHYWPFVDITMDDDDNVYIVIHKPGSKAVSKSYNWCSNYFLYRLYSNELAIRQWFADKIKKIVAQERKDRKDEPGCDLRFRADNNTELDYMGLYDQPITVAEAYSVYKTLKG